MATEGVSSRRYATAFAVLGTLAGLTAAAVVLASSEVADFLGEGPARVLPEGDARRVIIGVGTILATLLVGWGAHMLRRRPAAGLAPILIGLATGLFLLHAIFFLAAALFAVAILLDRLDGTPRERLAAWAPRRKPGQWAVGSALGIAALIGVTVLSVWLLRPLFDEGKELHEELAFQLMPASMMSMAATSTPNAGGIAAPMAAVLAKGELVGEDSFHFGNGMVQIIRTPDGRHIVRFQDYEVRNGPDLFVYVSPDAEGDVSTRGATNISSLKATSGDVSYELPADIDASTVRSVVIYCRQFRVPFAVARLTPP